MGRTSETELMGKSAKRERKKHVQGAMRKKSRGGFFRFPEFPTGPRSAVFFNMAKSADDPRTFISQVSLVGRGGGAVKALAGFKKSHHTVPDAVNAATQGFFAKLCAGELAAEAEDFFQRARAGLGY